MKRSRKIVVVIAVAIFFAAVVALGLWRASTPEYAWGIKIEGVRLTAGGYMLDFRYKVLDAGKAMPLFDGKVAPYLIDLKTGAKFMVAAPPKIGALRTTSRGTPPKEDRGYFMIFGNPWHYVKAGNKVAIVVGDFTSGEITVQ